MIIDVHCHYTLSNRIATGGQRFSFEPAHTADGPALDSFVSPRARRRFTFRAFCWLLGLGFRTQPEERLDAALDAVYRRHLFAPGPIERFVLLAFDRYFDAAGNPPPPPIRRGDRGSDIYTSNSLVAALCRRHPDRFLFGASIHPYRPDAVACLDEVAAGGAVLVKWLPLHQNIDVCDARTLTFLRRCAALGMPLLIHYGAEFTLATQHPEFIAVGPLLQVLRRLRAEGAMPTVIVAHVATPVTPLGDTSSHRHLIAALRGEFRDAPLYADASALTTWGKIRYLRQLARAQDLHDKLVFGTDFPVPVALPRLRRDLGRAYREIAADPSWPQRVARVFRVLGFNEIVLHRAAGLLRRAATSAELSTAAISAHAPQ